MMAGIDKEKILIEEVKVVQDIIKRMASNSFSVKTWTITLIVATLLFKGTNNHILIAFIPFVGTQRIWPARAFTLGHLTHNDLATVRI